MEEKVRNPESRDPCECRHNKWQIVDRTSDAPGGRQDPTPKQCETCGLMRRVVVITDEHSPKCHPSRVGELFEGPTLVPPEPVPQEQQHKIEWEVS